MSQNICLLIRIPKQRDHILQGYLFLLVVVFVPNSNYIIKEVDFQTRDARKRSR